MEHIPETEFDKGADLAALISLAQDRSHGAIKTYFLSLSSVCIEPHNQDTKTAFLLAINGLAPTELDKVVFETRDVLLATQRLSEQRLLIPFWELLLVTIGTKYPQKAFEAIIEARRSASGHSSEFKSLFGLANERALQSILPRLQFENPSLVFQQTALSCGSGGGGSMLKGKFSREDLKPFSSTVAGRVHSFN